MSAFQCCAGIVEVGEWLLVYLSMEVDNCMAGLCCVFNQTEDLMCVS